MNPGLSVLLSIIVINYNTRDLLRACLTSIYQQTRKIDFEVIVVDNASTDGSREMLAQKFPTVKMILNAVNKGFAAANNQAIRQAAGQYLLLLNSDTVVLDGAIDKTVAFMKQHQEASIVGCKLLNPDGTLQPSCRSFPSLWNLFTEAFFLYRIFKHSSRFGEYYMSHFDHESIREVEAVMGAFMLVRREVFAKAGMLDESYFMYSEEIEFCYRAGKQGCKVYFMPSAQIIHSGGGSIERAQAHLEQVHQSQLQFIRAHFTGLQKYLGLFLKHSGIAIRILAYFCAGLFTLNRRLVQKARSYSLVLSKTLR